MFGKIKSLEKKVNAFDQPKVMEEIMSDPVLNAQMVDLNQQQLYEEGVQADGTPTGQYAPITVSYYKPKAASEGRDGRSDHITGKDTGITYASMRVVPGAEGVVITADDRNNFFDHEPKGLGLTKESLTQIRPHVYEAFKEKFVKSLT